MTGRAQRAMAGRFMVVASVGVALGWMASGAGIMGSSSGTGGEPGVGHAMAASGAMGMAHAGDATGERLSVVWTSGDPEVAHRVGLMYTHAAKRQGWFDEVELIVWGPSQRLLVADKDVRAKVDQMREDGVVVRACVVCARSYGIVDDLEAMGLEVKPMGAPLTDRIQSDWSVISF